MPKRVIHLGRLTQYHIHAGCLGGVKTGKKGAGPITKDARLLEDMTVHRIISGVQMLP